MKKIYILAAAVLVAVSCTLDNYAAPDSSFSGRILDAETGDPIESDIINGTLLHYYEEGYTGLQSSVVKADGSFHIGQLFQGDYRIIPLQTNFEKPDTLKIKITGNTRYDFQVQPYIRISNVSVISSGSTKISATFTVENVNKDRGVMKAGLFVHPEPNVGAFLCQESRELTIGGLKLDKETYTIVFDYSESAYVKPGRKYYVRVGAISDAPSARYNYAPAVEVEL